MTGFSIGKYRGDDQYSWAVFDRRGMPVVTGLSRNMAKFHKKQLEEKDD